MQQSQNTRQILDLDFQKELYQEDLKKLVSNIQDKQKSYNDTRLYQNELVQKIIRICYQKYEDDIIKKRIELQELKSNSEEQKAKQDEEYSNLEMELKNKIVNVFISFQKYYEKIAQEKTKLEEYIVGDAIDSDNTLILQSVHQSLSDFELARENECINQQTFLSLKSPNVHTKQHQKMSHLNSYVNTLISKIENADQQILNNQSENSQIQLILSQKLMSLKQQIRQLQQFNHDSIQEVYDLQQDFLKNQKNLRNLRLNIQNSVTKDEERKCAEIAQLEQQKSDMDKTYKSYTQIMLMQMLQFFYSFFHLKICQQTKIILTTYNILYKEIIKEKIMKKIYSDQHHYLIHQSNHQIIVLNNLDHNQKHLLQLQIQKLLLIPQSKNLIFQIPTKKSQTKKFKQNLLHQPHRNQYILEENLKLKNQDQLKQMRITFHLFLNKLLNHPILEVKFYQKNKLHCHQNVLVLLNVNVNNISKNKYILVIINYISIKKESFYVRFVKFHFKQMNIIFTVNLIRLKINSNNFKILSIPFGNILQVQH